MAGQPVEKTVKSHAGIELARGTLSSAHGHEPVRSEIDSPLSSVSLARGGAHVELRASLQRERAAEQASQLVSERERLSRATESEENIDIFSRFISWVARLIKQLEQRLLGRLNQMGPLGRIIARAGRRKDDRTGNGAAGPRVGRR